MNRQWLVEVRNSAGLTQQQVAEGARVKRAYYTQIENGTRNPSVPTAQRIAQALGLDWTLFFDGGGRSMRQEEDELAATLESAG